MIKRKTNLYFIGERPRLLLTDLGGDANREMDRHLKKPSFAILVKDGLETSCYCGNKIIKKVIEI